MIIPTPTHKYTSARSDGNTKIYEKFFSVFFAGIPVIHPKSVDSLEAKTNARQ